MNNSIISVNIGGGLGNMMFQAAFAYAFSLEKNCQYELINFDLNCQMNSRWLGRHGFYTDNIFKWFDLSPKNGETIIIPEAPFHYEPQNFYENKKNIYSGYFQSFKYFGDFESEVRSMFYPSKKDLQNLKSKYQINFKDFISLHVRRGDYVFQPDNHPVLPALYFEKCTEYYGKKKQYLIFSDDIQWCKDNLSYLPNAIFVENELDFNTLYMMSMCSDYVISNSSFSLWGVFINPHDKQVLKPEIWFGKNYSHLNTSDLAPSHWKSIGF